MKKMLVPLDGSQASEVVLPTARATAKACGYEMILFSVWDIGLDAATHDQERVRTLSDRGQEYLRTYLHGIAREVEQDGLRCDGDVRAGHPAVEILAAVTGLDIDLLAMATHGRRATTEGRRGSVADKVLRNSTVPVLAAGPISQPATPRPRPASIRRILVPLDGTDDAEQGLVFALKLARPLAARIEILTVVESPLEQYGAALPEGYPATVDEEGRLQASRYLEDVQGRYPEVAAAYVEMGVPRREIRRFLETSKFDLVVMMSRSRHGRGLWKLGGVADQVIEGPLPVVIVPPTAE